MHQSPAGWYEDDVDPSLARWWDGERWTPHTMAVADVLHPHRRASTRFPWPAAAPGVLGVDDPAPAALAPPDPPTVPAATRVDRYEPYEPYGTFEDPVVEGEHAGALPLLADPALDTALSTFGWPHDDREYRDGAGSALTTRVRELPLWTRVAAPIAALALALGAFAILGASEGSTTRTTADTTEPTETTARPTTTTAVTFLPPVEVSTLDPLEPIEVTPAPEVEVTPTTVRRAARPAPRPAPAPSPPTTAATTTTAAPDTTTTVVTTTTVATTCTTAPGEYPDVCPSA